MKDQKAFILLGICLVVILKTEMCSATIDLVASIRNITHIPKPGKELTFENGYEFQMFCRIGENKKMFNYFRTVTLRIISSAEDIKLMKGHSPKDIYLQYTQSTRWLLWIANVLPWRVRDTHFPTFNTSCVGISTSQPYSATLIIRPVDPWKIVILVAGIALFFLAPKLSKSTLFFYSSGTFLGGIAAALVFLFIFTRVLPKGRVGYLSLSVLWTLAFYFAGETWKRIEELIQERLPYVVLYLTSGALIAFLACYRWGPPSHPRTLDIMRWILQICGLVLIHFSSDLVEMSTAIIILIVTYHNTHGYFNYLCRRNWQRMFPPKQIFLTEEEYIQQGAIETQKSLDELRSFCSSPESKPWKLVTQLRDPRRFSGFIEGGSHLSDDEVLAYESDESVSDDIMQRQIQPLSPPRSPAYPPLNELLTDDEDSFNPLETDDEG